MIMMAMSIILAFISVVLFTINFLYDFCSETTEATVVRVKSRLKSFDSTIEKRIGHDYIYEYEDSCGNKRTGTIIKNSPATEFSVGDKISIRYIKNIPAFSLHQKISTIPFVTLVMSIILFVLGFITI